ncbi:MAG: hypothetical protein PVI78_02355 [Anaerolineales bacterium]|jgi:hypothetical protein
MKDYLQASLDLHCYLINIHWDGHALRGSDPIGKINWRITRFVKSYIRWPAGKDRLVYQQGLAYWAIANSYLYEMTNEAKCLDLMGRSADFALDQQLDNGTWKHPPIWGRRDFISTVETTWACLGLAHAYQVLKDQAYLEAARKGLDAIIEIIGLREVGQGKAVNYYAHSNVLVPNVTTMVLRLMGILQLITGDESHLTEAPAMIAFLKTAQMGNGELQYIYFRKPHFQSYQYNAYQFMDLASYYRTTGDETIRPLLAGIAKFLVTGQQENGACRFGNNQERPEVTYFTAALANALMEADALALGDYASQAELSYRHLLTRQGSKGEFPFSRYNYGFLTDTQSYPRYLAMILYHILSGARIKTAGKRPVH